MELCYQLPVLPLDRPVPKHVLSRRGAISFSSSSSLFGAPDPRQLSQVNNKTILAVCQNLASCLPREANVGSNHFGASELFECSESSNVAQTFCLL